MQQPANKKALVAIDLGAQSCRVSLLRWERGVPEIRIAHRLCGGDRGGKCQEQGQSHISFRKVSAKR